jgi:hypothetical protein
MNDIATWLNDVSGGFGSSVYYSRLLHLALPPYPHFPLFPSIAHTSHSEHGWWFAIPTDLRD